MKRDKYSCVVLVDPNKVYAYFHFIKAGKRAGKLDIAGGLIDRSNTDDSLQQTYTFLDRDLGVARNDLEQELTKVTCVDDILVDADLVIYLGVLSEESEDRYEWCNHVMRKLLSSNFATEEFVNSGNEVSKVMVLVNNYMQQPNKSLEELPNGFQNILAMKQFQKLPGESDIKKVDITKAVKSGLCPECGKSGLLSTGQCPACGCQAER